MNVDSARKIAEIIKSIQEQDRKLTEVTQDLERVWKDLREVLQDDPGGPGQIVNG